MSDIPPVTGYVSDAELMAWLETKSDSQYGELRDAMSASTQRIDLIKDLTDLKNSLEHATTEQECQKIGAQMVALVDKYQDTPYAQEVGDLLNPTISALDHTGEDVVQNAADSFSGDQASLSQLKDPISAETDKLGKIDALELVQIQQLVSDAKETTQLASNVMSSRDQTANSIVGNIRG